MTDLVLRDIDSGLADRIRRVAESHGWTMHQTILHLIERGLFASEGGPMRFDRAEVDVMQSLIAALEEVPDDPGFSLIGRAQLSATADVITQSDQATAEASVAPMSAAVGDESASTQFDEFIQNIPINDSR